MRDAGPEKEGGSLSLALYRERAFAVGGARRGTGGSLQVEDFPEIGGDGATVRIGGHEVAHVGPPLLADGGLGDGGPARFILNFRVGEELARLGMEKDAVVADAVLFQHRFQTRPNGAVPPLVLELLAGVDGHDEGLANHSGRLKKGSEGRKQREGDEDQMAGNAPSLQVFAMSFTEERGNLERISNLMPFL